MAIHTKAVLWLLAQFTSEELSGVTAVSLAAVTSALRWKSLGLSHEFSLLFKPLKSSKQGKVTHCFSKNALFTKEIISA